MKSLIFHVIVVIVVSGAFLFKDDMIEPKETPIQVSFVSEAQFETETKKPVTVEEEPPAPPAEEKPQPAPKALQQPEPEPKPLAEETKEVEKVERIEPETEPEPEPTPAPAPKKPKEKPKPKPEPEPEPETKAEPEKKPEPKKVEEKKPEKPKEKETKTLDSLLKNLADTQPVDTTREGPKLTEAPVSQPVTAGEIDALNAQLRKCWSVLPGAAQADALAVQISISVNQDRTVRDVQIEDRSRYNSDPYFRAAADNAIRAIKHPNCTPLDLPIGKYDEWKTIDMNFDPQNMF